VALFNTVSAGLIGTGSVNVFIKCVRSFVKSCIFPLLVYTLVDVVGVLLVGVVLVIGGVDSAGIYLENSNTYGVPKIERSVFTFLAGFCVDL
jgi:hypothetical protein